MNPLHWSFRTAFAVAALVCAALLAFAYYAQFELGLEPCPLCIFQRVGFIAVLVVALLAAIHNPRGGGRRVYGVFALIAASFGLAVAGRHVWMTHLPADQVPACGPDLAFMLDNFPLSKALKMAFTGSGECAKVDWTFAGLSMPAWALLWFAVLALGAIWFGFRRAPR